MASSSQQTLSACLESLDYDVHCCIGKACMTAASVFMATPMKPVLASSPSMSSSKGSSVHVGIASGGSEPQPVAVRVCPADDESDSEIFTSLQNEIRLLRQLRHQNIITCISSFIWNDLVITVQPLMDLGSVTDVIHAGFLFGIPELCISFITQEVLKALAYLHGRDVIHRAVRASHILLGSVGQGKVLLSGFRYATSMVNNGKRCLRIHEFPASYRSNLLWAAPEILQQNIAGYGTRSDVYSLGITLCEMANGFPPFADMEHMQMLLEKLRGTTPRLLDALTCGSEVSHEHSDHSARHFSQHFHEFTDVCLRSNPNSRPSVPELKSHDFFRQLRKNKLSLRQMLVPVIPITAKGKRHNNSELLTSTPRSVAMASVEMETDIDDIAWDF